MVNDFEKKLNNKRVELSPTEDGNVLICEHQFCRETGDPEVVEAMRTNVNHLTTVLESLDADIATRTAERDNVAAMLAAVEKVQPVEPPTEVSLELPVKK